MDAQIVLVLAVIAVAVFYIAIRWRNVLRGKTAGCACGRTQCSTAAQCKPSSKTAHEPGRKPPRDAAP